VLHILFDGMYIKYQILDSCCVYVCHVVVSHFGMLCIYDIILLYPLLVLCWLLLLFPSCLLFFHVNIWCSVYVQHTLCYPCCF
jgi:hypothetical protein